MKARSPRTGLRATSTASRRASLRLVWARVADVVHARTVARAVVTTTEAPARTAAAAEIIADKYAIYTVPYSKNKLLGSLFLDIKIEVTY